MAASDKEKVGFTIFLTIAIVILIVIVIIIVVYILWEEYLVGIFNGAYEEICNQCSEQPCTPLQPDFPPPSDPLLFDPEVSRALFKITYNSSFAASKCPGTFPPPLPPGYTELIEITAPDPSDQEETTFAYIYDDPANNRAIICFPAVSLAGEFVDASNYQQVAPTELNNYQEGYLCHKGFYDIYNAIRSKIINWWLGSNTTLLYICGYSLGAPVSSLCAFDMAKFLGPDDYPIVYSWGSPRVMNPAMANEFKNLLPTNMRVANTEDLVIELPPATFSGYTYQQLDNLITFSQNFGSLQDNHVTAYLFDASLPGGCFDNHAPCE